MTLVTCDITVSLDGYAAGPHQRRDEPLGDGGEQLHRWMFPARGEDQRIIDEWQDDVGAYVMGRNMFAGPGPGPWDADWRGWWGEDPPYHHDVFVLTHHARPPLAMDGGTTFHFVTDGIHAALERAREAAGDLDVKIGGGVSTVRQYLQAGLIDELHLAISPVLLGRGEALFEGLDLPALGYRVTDSVATELATHVVIGRETGG